MALAWVSGAIPLLILTKADLVDDAETVAADVAAAAPGVDVVVVSSTTGEGLDLLETWLRPGRTLVLLGQSGVGKSTLVNALSGFERVATGDVGARGKGRHVTTSRELVRLPSGAVLLDTPGLRGVGVVGDVEGIDATFPEIDELADECRFGDCSHTSEPGLRGAGRRRGRRARPAPPRVVAQADQGSRVDGSPRRRPADGRGTQALEADRGVGAPQRRRTTLTRSPYWR